MKFHLSYRYLRHIECVHVKSRQICYNKNRGKFQIKNTFTLSCKEAVLFSSNVILFGINTTWTFFVHHVCNNIIIPTSRFCWRFKFSSISECFESVKTKNDKSVEREENNQFHWIIQQTQRGKILAEYDICTNTTIGVIFQHRT